MLVSCRPTPPLASCIEGLWCYDGQSSGSHCETVLPNGRLQIGINLASGQGSVGGIRSHHALIDRAIVPSMVGIVFRSGGPEDCSARPPMISSTESWPLKMSGAHALLSCGIGCWRRTHR